MRIFNSGIKTSVDTGTIELEGMEFHAFHGCLYKEQTEGNLFVVDIKAEVYESIEQSAKTDNLKDTVDVNLIYKAVKKEMEHRCNLIETVACNILNAVRKVSDDFASVEVRVSKHNPPLEGKCEWSRVTVRWEE